MGVSSLPKTVTRQRRDCDLNPGLLRLSPARYPLGYRATQQVTNENVSYERTNKIRTNEMALAVGAVASLKESGEHRRFAGALLSIVCEL